MAANVKVDVYTEYDRRAFDAFDYLQAADALILIGSSLNQIGTSNELCCVKTKELRLENRFDRKINQLYC